jgi:L-asparaginase II
MARRPDLIGGTGRFDTRLMDGTRSRLLAKSGAEGVQGIADRDRGSGMCLKVRDGAARAVGPATLEALHALGWIGDEALRALDDLWHPVVTNHSAVQVGHFATRTL